MSAILRLYPRAWRERYGDEIAALLEERPASLLDQLDLIRGALDARLHPQVTGADAAPEQEIPMNQKQLDLVAAIGGIAWILGVASMVMLPAEPGGYRDVSLALIGFAVGIVLIGVALGELGTRRGSATSARTGHVVAVISVAFGGLMLMPWPLFVIGLLGFQVLAFAAALRGANNGALPGWVVVVFAGAAVASIGGSLGGVETDAGIVLIILIGPAALPLAWSAFTSPTDTPEVSPA